MHRALELRLLAPIVAALAVAACGSLATERPTAPVSGIVLMVGDGMGPSQITFARNLELGLGRRFAFEKLPVTALVSTWSASNPTTDSAAASTAMASGVKTANKAIGVDPRGSPLRSLAETAREQGWAVGYVTTTALTHATPAGFYAHVENRYDDEERIAEQLLEHAPAVALGGGLGWFLEEADGGYRSPASAGSEPGAPGGLLERARRAGYTIWTRPEEIASPPPAPLLGLFAKDELAYEIDALREPEARRAPTLDRLTRIALEVLEAGGRPFFLLVEGGRIDQAAHAFDGPTMAREIRAFDRAVAAVTEFRARRPGTLVLVTADHATGGLAINDWVDWDMLREQRASVDWLVAEIQKRGAGQEAVAEMTGYDDFTEEEISAVRGADNRYTAGRLLGTALSQRNGATWVPPEVSDDTYGHTGEDVPLWAAGPGAERFQGVLDNTELPVILCDLLGWPPPN